MMKCEFCGAEEAAYSSSEEGSPFIRCSSCPWIEDMNRSAVTMDDLAFSICRWNQKQFGPQPLLSKAKHLRKEVDELIASLEAGGDGRKEWVDVFFFACQPFHLLPALKESVAAKLAKNKRRVWPDKPDADGVFEHKDGIEDDD